MPYNLMSVPSANDSKFTTNYALNPLSKAISESLYANTKDANYSSATNNKWADYILAKEKPLLGGLNRMPSLDPHDEESMILRAVNRGLYK